MEEFQELGRGENFQDAQVSAFHAALHPVSFAHSVCSPLHLPRVLELHLELSSHDSTEATIGSKKSFVRCCTRFAYCITRIITRLLV